jgi:hypothetical protein
MSTQIRMLITAKTYQIVNIQSALKAYIEHQNYLMAVLEQEIYELKINLDLLEPEPLEQIDEEEDYPCYDCGRTILNCMCFHNAAKRAKLETPCPFCQTVSCTCGEI